MELKIPFSEAQQRALKTTLYAGCGGCFGLFARWLQLMMGFDDMNLPKSSVWHFLFPMIVIAAAVVYRQMVKDFGKDRLSLPEDFCGAYACSNPLIYGLRIVAGAVLIAGSVLLLMTCETEKQATLMRVVAALGILSGVAYPWMLTLARDPESNVNLRCLLSVPPVLLFACWLLLTYKMNDINSVEWSFGVALLADCAGLYAFLRFAGFAFSVPAPGQSQFWAMFCPFCFLVTLADSRALSLDIMYVGVLLISLLNNWIFTENLVQGEAEKPAYTDAVETGGFEHLSTPNLKDR